MEQYETIFLKFNRNKKNFLTKHELKLCLIALFGSKPRYQQLKNYWQNRLEFSQNVPYDEKQLLQCGVTLKYFYCICKEYEKTINEDSQLQLDFKILNKDSRGVITKNDFQKLFEEQKSLNEQQKVELFSIIDYDQNGLITFKEFKQFMQM